jgi:tape measure domain-containing protein
MTGPIDSATVAIVPDFSRFASEADRGIESALRDLVTEVRTALDRVAAAAGAAGNDLGREFQQGGERAEAALRELSRTATVSMNNVERQTDQAAGGISTKLGGALGILKTGLIGAGVGAAAGLGALTTFGLQAAAAMEQTQVAFNSLLGGVEEGTKVFAGLKDFAAATPFELPELADAAKRFLAFSGSVGLAKDQLEPFLTTLGNIASVTGGGAQAMSSVALALGQIGSSGKVTLEEINQISGALPGFNGVAAIAAAKGISAAEAMKQISAGTVGATEGVAALLAGMQKFPGAAGAMEQQAQTLLGVFSTFKDTLSQALVDGFAPVIPEIKQSLTDITPALGAALGELAPALGSALSAVIPLITELVQFLVPVLKPIIDGIGTLVRTAGDTGGLANLGKAIGQIAQALAPLFPVIGEVVGALANALVPVALALAPIIADLAPTLADLALAFIPLLPPIGELVGALLLIVAPLIKAAAAFLQWLSIEGLLPLVTLLAKGLGFLADAVAEFGKFLEAIDWNAVGNAIGGAFAAAWEAVVAFFEGSIQFWTELPGKIGAAIAALPGLLVSLAQRAFDGFFTAVGFGIATIIKFFIDLPGQVAALVALLWTTAGDLFRAGIAAVVGFVSELPGKVVALVTDLWTRVKANFSAGVTAVVDFAKALPGRIMAAISSLPGQLVEMGRNMIGGLIDGIKGAVGRAIDAVKRAMADIVNGAKAALGIASPSRVFADAVGKQIPAGIVEGIHAGLPELQAALNDATRPAITATGPGGAAGSLASVIINVGGVHFTGAIPTEAEAHRTGQAVGAGIVAELERRDIATAVRTV